VDSMAGRDRTGTGGQFGVFDIVEDRSSAAQQEPQVPHPRTTPESMVSETSAPQVESRFRGLMVDRLTLMADRHRRHVEEQQGSRRAVGRHALGFFYADELAGAAGLEVVAATRLMFDSAETAEIVALLDTLIERAREQPTGAFDPRIHMCNRVEPMSSAPRLVGVGVTSVSLPLRDDASGYAALGMNRPYRAVARMDDGTAILLRCGGGFLARVDVRSTNSLNVNARHTRHWEWMSSALLHSPDTQLADILPRLETLLDLATGRATQTSAGDPSGSQLEFVGAGPSRRKTVRLGARRRR
jgi:hypothetical protein